VPVVVLVPRVLPLPIVDDAPVDPEPIEDPLVPERLALVPSGAVPGDCIGLPYGAAVVLEFPVPPGAAEPFALAPVPAPPVVPVVLAPPVAAEPVPAPPVPVVWAMAKPLTASEVPKAAAIRVWRSFMTLSYKGEGSATRPRSVGRALDANSGNTRAQYWRPALCSTCALALHERQRRRHCQATREAGGQAHVLHGAPRRGLEGWRA
jgi:hypothetical protein